MSDDSRIGVVGGGSSTFSRTAAAPPSVADLTFHYNGWEIGPGLDRCTAGDVARSSRGVSLNAVVVATVL